jgi:integrase
MIDLSKSRTRAGQKKLTRHSDGHNLYLAVRNGRGFWVYQFRDGANIRSKGLGSATTMTAAAARRAREEFIVARRRGSAPGMTRHDAAPAAVSFGEAAAEYQRNHAAEWGDRQQRHVKALFRNHAAPLDARPVNQLTARDIAAVVGKVEIWRGPNTGQGARLRGLIEHVLRAEGIDPNPASWERVQNHVSKKNIEAVPFASMPWRDVPAFMAELLPHQSTIAQCLRFTILTGVRTNEAIGAEWREINLQEWTWTIPKEKMKAGQQHVVPLSDAAIACLGPKTSGIVFRVTNTHTGAINASGLNKLLKKYRPDVTVHGFRSSFATWAQEHGFPTEVIDAALAHKERSRTRRAYLRSDLLPERRKLAHAWARFATAS